MVIYKKFFIYLCLSAGCAYFSRVAITYLPVNLQLIEEPKYYIGSSTVFFGAGYFLSSYIFNIVKPLRNLIIYFIYPLAGLGFAILFYAKYVLFPCLILGIAFGYIFAFINLCLLNQASDQVSVSIYRIFLNAGAAIGSFMYSLLTKNYNIVLLISTVLIIVSYFFLKATLMAPREVIKKTVKFSLIKDKIFIAFCLFDLLVGVIYSQFYLAFPIYLKINYSSGLINFGIMSIISSIAIIFLEYPFTKKLKNINQKWTFFFGAFFISFSLGMIPFTHSIFQIYICFIFYILGEIIYFPSAAFAVKVLCKDINKLDAYVSYSSAMSGLSIVIAPLFFTAIYTTFNINFIWYLSLITSSLCVIIFFIISIKLNRSLLLSKPQ